MDWSKQMGDLHKCDPNQNLEMNHFQGRRANIEPQKKSPIPLVTSKTKNALSSLNVLI